MKEIENYPDYFINENGDVFSKKQGKLKQLRRRKDRGGYLAYMLRVNGKPKSVLGHRLVALSFIDNIENKPCVNHKNLNREDNRVENLEWVNHSENVIHGIVLRKRKNHLRKVSDDLLIKIKLEIMNYKFGDCKKISIKYNIPYKIIQNIKLNKYYKNY